MTTIQVIDERAEVIVQAPGPQGPQGIAGPAGAAGPAGERGEPGPVTVAVGTTTTAAAGSSASVVNTGTAEDVVLAFTIPRGNVGATGSAGPAGADGSDGADGREVELQKSATHVQWRYAGDVSWTNLVALADLKGDQGDTGPAGPTGSTGATGAQGVAGDDGREVELQKTSTHIQWRYVGDVSWTNLVALTDITGPTGATGAAGATGATGAAGPGVAAGGTSGQILSKASSTDYDTAWSSLKTINSNSLLGAGDLVLTTSPAGSTGQLQYNSGSGAFSGASGLTTTGTELTIASGTKTTSAPALDATQTWNAAGTTFTGLRLNVTDTASAAASNLIDVGTGGGTYVSKFRVSKDGPVSVPDVGTRVAQFNAGSTGNGYRVSTYPIIVSATRNSALFPNANNIYLRSDHSLNWSTGATDANETVSVTLTSDGTNTLAQRNGTNAQTLRVYGTTDSGVTNYERLSIRSGVTYSGAKYNVIAAEAGGTGAANQGLVLSPLGSGALMCAVPDGTAVGGNARGTYAIDLQPLRSAANQVASADGSIAIGNRNVSSNNSAISIGLDNTASGNSSTAIGTTASATAVRAVAFSNAVASGVESFAAQGNTASGQSSAAFGNSAVANKRAQFGVGMTSFSTFGDAQWSVLGFRGSTTNATATEIFLAGQSSTRATVPASTTWMADVSVIARSSGGTDNACFKRRCVIKRDGSNNTALVGSVQTVDTDIGSNSGSPPTGWAVTITADDTNEALKIEVTGADATNIRWVAKVDLVEVGFA